MVKILSVALLLISSTALAQEAEEDVQLLLCPSVLTESIVEEIASYKEVTEEIIDYVLNGAFKGQTYDRLAEFVDTFGSRLAGSQTLEDSIDYIVQKSFQEDLDVHTEYVEVTYWQRGEENAALTRPRHKNLPMLGLGKSVATPLAGITAEVVVVDNFEQLNALTAEKVNGKIVLFTAPFVTYGETNVYRTSGASEAAKKGAVAALVKSVTPFSISSPHTGSQSYQDGVMPIPIAAITVEDANMIGRIANRGETVVVHLKMSGASQTRISRNAIVDLKGSSLPDKRVVVSGHIDSWDVGQGAMDDAGGVYISWAAPIILKRLNITPKRTLRAIFWTGEEVGIMGANAYIQRHQDELDSFTFVMESDYGTFTPQGITFKGTEEAQCIMSEILKLFEGINATSLELSNSPGPDLAAWTSQGVPSAGLANAADRYFWFHHTEGDTMEVENTRDLDLATAFWTAFSYIIADLSFDIPK